MKSMKYKMCADVSVKRWNIQATAPNYLVEKSEDPESWLVDWETPNEDHLLTNIIKVSCLAEHWAHIWFFSARLSVSNVYPWTILFLEIIFWCERPLGIPVINVFNAANTLERESKTYRLDGFLRLHYFYRTTSHTGPTNQRTQHGPTN